MEKRIRKKCETEFKRQAAGIADTSGMRDRAIEQELGLCQGAIKRWRT